MRRSSPVPETAEKTRGIEMKPTPSLEVQNSKQIISFPNPNPLGDGEER